MSPRAEIDAGSEVLSGVSADLAVVDFFAAGFGKRIELCRFFETAPGFFVDSISLSPIDGEWCH